MCSMQHCITVTKSICLFHNTIVDTYMAYSRQRWEEKRDEMEYGDKREEGKEDDLP